MSEDASYDYEALQKALYCYRKAAALVSLEPLRISRDRLTILPGRRFSGGYGVVFKASLKGQGSDLGVQDVAIKKLRMAEDDDLRVTIVMDVASGLIYLHGLVPPICHGDIKPALANSELLQGNILITHEIRGMLADFGLSRALQANSTGLTTSKTIKGSLRYMSPELLIENASHTLASDVWAFGCVALEVECLPCTDMGRLFFN
ncbi:hypothetical protein FRC04_008464 [Tulasnella sp. 424]|nr:hypothetical protein FRC04_008464 [Tulasnella sp. 424]